MLELLKSLFRRTQGKGPAPTVESLPPLTEVRPQGVKLSAPPDPKAAPGKRVYHEYFVGDAPQPDGQWRWDARVYVDGKKPVLGEGFAKSRYRAGEAAINWATAKKVELRKEIA